MIGWEEQDFEREDGLVLTYAPYSLEEIMKQYFDCEKKEKKMTNAEWIQSKGWKFGDLTINIYDMDSMAIYLQGSTYIDTYNRPGMRPVEAILKWLDEEHYEKVLNDTEKAYLSAVIKPFRDRILYIVKRRWANMTECIDIKTEIDTTSFPRFKANDMYKGMKVDRRYTLEELGL